MWPLQEGEPSTHYPYYLEWGSACFSSIPRAACVSCATLARLGPM